MKKNILVNLSALRDLVVQLLTTKTLRSLRSTKRNAPKFRFHYIPFSIFYFLSSIFFFTSCTRDIPISVPSVPAQFVVEGHIQTGSPPYVILTRSSDFFSTFYLDSINELFVHDAIVKVSDGTDTIQLKEFKIDTAGTQVSIYLGLGMLGEAGKTYSLSIEAEGKALSSVTTIDLPNPLDSIWWEPANIEENDSAVRLVCRYTDPPEPGNYVRYFTKENSQPFYPGLNSVFSDDLVNGTTFNFTLDKGIPRSDTSAFYPGKYQFKKGDTITLEWAAIDKAQYNFWNTLEFELNGDESPFASPVIIQGNITGGLGIWGGYSPTYKTIIVPRN